MALENLTIRRVCLHEVYPRTDERTIQQPTYAPGLLQMNARARAAFTSRVLAAFRSEAQCMGMTIARHGPGSVAATGLALLNVSDAAFVIDSRAFANGLAAAQTSRQIPGGLVVVFDGTVGHPAEPFFAIMKAELHEGFLKEQNLQATFVDSLFLSPKTKLYKIGMFVHQAGAPMAMPAGFSASVYDSQLTASQREGAALYFHGTFLGLEIPEDSAHQVRKFFDATRGFIASAPLTEEARVDLYNSLYTYLKVDQSPSVQYGAFADAYIPPDLADSYRDHMVRENVPDSAIPKDLAEVAGRLRVRRLRFPERITLSGPPDAMSELVEVEAIQGEEGEGWTRITVRGRLQSQE